MSGVCSGDQCLMHAAQLMQDSRSLSEYGVSHNSTIHLTVRLRGGAKGMQLVVKPRIQKDKWSNYWKVSSDPIHPRAQIQRALHTKSLVNLSQSFLAEALILSQVSSYFSASHLDNRVASSSEGRSRCCEHDPSVSLFSNGDARCDVKMHGFCQQDSMETKPQIQPEVHPTVQPLMTVGEVPALSRAMLHSSMMCSGACEQASWSDDILPGWSPNSAAGHNSQHKIVSA